MNATLLYPAQCFLGEGPFWHAGRESCFWVDIENRRLFEYPWQTPTPETTNVLPTPSAEIGLAERTPPPAAATVWQFDRRVSLILPSQQHRLVLGMQGGDRKSVV